MTAILEPALFKIMEDRYRHMSTFEGFRQAVMDLIGIRQRTPAILALSDRQLSDLLYRDTLVMKHTSSKHIQNALQNILLDKKKSTVKTTGAVTASIVEFIVEAGPGPRHVEL